MLAKHVVAGLVSACKSAKSEIAFRIYIHRTGCFAHKELCNAMMPDALNLPQLQRLAASNSSFHSCHCSDMCLQKNPAHRTFLCQRKVRRFGRTQPDHRFDCLIHCVAELHGDCPSLVQALYSDRKKWHCQFAKGFWVLSRGQRMRRLDGWCLPQGSLQVAPSKIGTSSHTSCLAMRSEKVRYWHCMARFETALQSNGSHSDGS